MAKRDIGTEIEGSQDKNEVTHIKRKIFIIIYRWKRYVVNYKW